MRHLRLRLAQWIAPKGFLVILESLLPADFGRQGFRALNYRSAPVMPDESTLQKQFGAEVQTPAELWREVRKNVARGHK